MNLQFILWKSLFEINKRILRTRNKIEDILVYKQDWIVKVQEIEWNVAMN